MLLPCICYSRWKKSAFFAIIDFRRVLVNQTMSFIKNKSPQAISMLSGNMQEDQELLLAKNKKKVTYKNQRKLVHENHPPHGASKRNRIDIIRVLWERVIDSFFLHFAFLLLSIVSLSATVKDVLEGKFLSSFTETGVPQITPRIIFNICIAAHFSIDLVGQLCVWNTGLKDRISDILEIFLSFGYVVVFVIFRRWKIPLGIMKIFNVVINSSRFRNKLRYLISLNKQYILTPKYCVDLCYVSKNCIAMSIPACTWLQKFYRNSFSDIKKFLDDHHPNSYLVVNLCDKDEAVENPGFEDHVNHPLPDHSVGSFRDLIRLMVFLQKNIRASKSPQKKPKTLCVHCIGGKGRTGIICVCWMLLENTCKTALEAIQLFGARRTDDLLCGGLKTISNASQIRTTVYFEEVIKRFAGDVEQFLLEPPVAVRVRKLEIDFKGESQVREGISIEIYQHRIESLERFASSWTSDKVGNLMSGSRSIVWDLNEDPIDITEDFNIGLFLEGKIQCFLYLHCSFLNESCYLSTPSIISSLSEIVPPNHCAPKSFPSKAFDAHKTSSNSLTLTFTDTHAWNKPKSNLGLVKKQR
eukprot:GHVP01050984.1.p1 GENE.GHVP01050984.1~~GHVP01050984.1.p1  ORF type:complete len:582 (-),score=72.27 GHVP01050984.1:626-2371(-)